MQHSFCKAYPIKDFPLKGGIFQPKTPPCLVEISEVGNGCIGSHAWFIRKNVKIGSKNLPKGTQIISRLRYQVKNLTKRATGEVELIGVKLRKGEEIHFIASYFPIHKGDEIEVHFLGVNPQGVYH